MGRKKRNKQDELGPAAAAGQSGSIQQLSHTASVNSESVRELAAEGNAFEAGILEGVEDAKDPDVSEVRTREVPQDDVPAEYQNNDRARQCCRERRYQPRHDADESSVTPWRQSSWARISRWPSRGRWTALLH